MNRLTILHKGQKFALQASGRFAKDVLRVGEWVHPATKKKLVFDESRLSNLASETNRYHSNENKIPYPAGHSTSPLDNMGDWPGPFFKHKDMLIGIVEPKDQTALQKMRDGAMDSVSVCIEFDLTDSKGNHYPEVITHVAATDYPVITGQKPFIELSAAQKEADVYVPQELATALSNNPTAGVAGTHSRSTSMDLKQLAVALGLAADTPEDKIFEEAKRLKSAAVDPAAQLSAQQKKVSEQLAAHGFVLEGDKVTKLEKKPQTELEKELSTQLASVQLDQHKAKIAAAKAKVDSLVKSGLVKPAEQESLTRILSVVGKVESLSLSSNPEEIKRVPIDLATELEKFLGSLSSITKEKLNQLSKDDVDAAKQKSEQLSKQAAEVAARVQPQHASTK
jgi:hypothetical protein